MGPLGGLVRLFAKELGKKGGKVVTRDLQQANVAGWTHADKIAELKTDVGLSPSYVKELIENSKMDELKSIANYMGKENGYTSEVVKNLTGKVFKRIEEIENSNALKEIIKAFREKGLSLLEDHFDHFV